MKNIITLFIFIVCLLSCKAQTIVPMKSVYGSKPSGVLYYKDTDNFLDNFLGTWKYQNGNEELTMIIKKKLFYSYTAFFSDILYGEYKYINPSGNTLINTLNKIDMPMNESYHAISDATFISNNYIVKCTDCNPGEFRVKSFFEDPDREYIMMNVIFRYINPTTIKATVYKTGVAITDASQVDLPYEPQIPEEEYTMIKQ